MVQNIEKLILQHLNLIFASVKLDLQNLGENQKTEIKSKTEYDINMKPIKLNEQGKQMQNLALDLFNNVTTDLSKRL